MLKKCILILLTYMLCEFTYYISNDIVIMGIYFFGLAVLGLLYYKLMEAILDATNKRFKK